MKLNISTSIQAVRDPDDICDKCRKTDIYVSQKVARLVYQT